MQHCGMLAVHACSLRLSAECWAGFILGFMVYGLGLWQCAACIFWDPPARGSSTCDISIEQGARASGCAANALKGCLPLLCVV